MSTKHLIATIVTVAYTILAAATTATSAFADTPAPAATTATAAENKAAKVAQKDSGLTREQVRAQVIEARKNGQLPETEADFDIAQTKKHVVK
jgi:FlaG/FlaF family flagellin (archaellin)